MRVVRLQTSRAVISSDHDHDISFSLYHEELKGFVRIDTLETGNNVCYVAFAGDPIIKYTFDASKSTEVTRLKKLPDTCPYVKTVTTDGNDVTLHTDFDGTPTNKLISVDQSWVSSNASYSITSKTTAPILTRLEIDPEGCSVVKKQYCLLDNGTVELDTPTNKLVCVTDDIEVNGVELKAGQITTIVGNVSLSSTSKAGVIIIEYTT